MATSKPEQIVASLNLTENMSLALDYRMSGLSYPEIAKLLSRAVSTVYEYKHTPNNYLRMSGYI